MPDEPITFTTAYPFVLPFSEGKKKTKKQVLPPSYREWELNRGDVVQIQLNSIDGDKRTKKYVEKPVYGTIVAPEHMIIRPADGYYISVDIADFLKENPDVKFAGKFHTCEKRLPRATGITILSSYIIFQKIEEDPDYGEGFI